MTFLDVVDPGFEHIIPNGDNLVTATIFVAVIALVVIAVIVLILLLIKRSKRNKKSPEQQADPFYEATPTVGYPGKSGADTSAAAAQAPSDEEGGKTE